MVVDWVGDSPRPSNIGFDGSELSLGRPKDSRLLADSMNSDDGREPLLRGRVVSSREDVDAVFLLFPRKSPIRDSLTGEVLGEPNVCRIREEDERCRICSGRVGTGLLEREPVSEFWEVEWWSVGVRRGLSERTFIRLPGRLLKLAILDATARAIHQFTSLLKALTRTGALEAIHRIRKRTPTLVPGLDDPSSAGLIQCLGFRIRDVIRA